MKLAAFLLFLLAADASRIPAHFARSSRFLTPNVLVSHVPVNNSTEIELKQVLPSMDVPESTDVPVTDATSVNPQPSGQPVSIATPTMGIALNLGLCKNTTLPECESNSVFSPLSIASTMTLLMAGSSGSSYDQLHLALGYQSSADNDINAAYKDIITKLKDLNNISGNQLNIANGIFSREQLLPDYANKVQEYFSGEVHRLNASDETAGANQINEWVSRGTSGKITDVISSLPPDTKLIVANVIYMNAIWDEPFDVTSTSNEPFHVSATESITVPSMITTQTVDYFPDRQLGCQIMALPYKGQQVAFYVVLPTDKNGIESLLTVESRLSDASVLNALIDKMVQTQLTIQLPKFSFRQKLNLKSSLQDMGVVDLFQAGSADLARMTATPGTAVDDIVHEAVIDVNERGTEAAGATVVLVTRDGVSRSFVANQPFHFFVMERSSRTVLFSGRVVRPQ